MVTDNHYRWDFIGLSTDTKPTPETSPKVVNGSTYYCSDTSKLYVWYKDQWYERKPLGGGGGGGTDDFDQLDNRPKYKGALMTGSTDIPEVITYSDFTGTDGTAAGTAGLVPAPSILDTDKYLKSDGTWASVSGGGASYTAGDGIDITNSVISATNTGKARELTADDYNWPTNNPASVALWLLEPGVYYSKSNVIISRDNLYTSNNSFVAIVGEYESGRKNVLSIEQPFNQDATIVQETLDATAGSLVSNSMRTFLLTSASVINSLTSTYATQPLSANQGKVLKDLVDSIAIRGAGAPTTSTAGEVGTLYEDTTNGDLYICTDATNPYVWEEVGAGGSGPAVVQTIGTSTTDVMSQNATTSMMYADPGTNTKIRIGSAVVSNVSPYGIAIGNSANTHGARAIALGVDAGANGQGAVAIGAGASAPTNGMVSIGTFTTSYGYNNSNYRLLSGLYAPQSAHDAVNKEYVDPTTDSSAPTASTAGRLGQIIIDTTDNSAYMCVVSDSTTPAYEWKKITA